MTRSDKKILLLGGSSFLGRHLFRALGAERAVATYCSSWIPGGVRFDALSDDLRSFLREFGPFSHAVILLGDTNPETCARDRDKSYALNVKSIKRIIDGLNVAGVKPIFMSSEFVFDGERGAYVEEDEVNPILTYGRQKVEIERYLRATCGRYAVVRLAKTFGSARSDGTLFTSWIRSIQEGREIRCARDQVFSPIHVEDAVKMLIRLIEVDGDGLFHLSSQGAYSRIELFQILIETMRRRKAVKPKMVPCSIHDFNLAERRPLNVSMRPEKIIRITGLAVRDPAEACGQIVSEFYRDGEIP